MNLAWWSMVITLNLAIVTFFLLLYFNNYSALYWLMDTSDRVLQLMEG